MANPQLRRRILSLGPANTAAIQAIESAILLVSLDDGPAPKTDDERAWMYWSGARSEEAGAGHGRNRWFDKHEIIVDEAGESGFNGERKFEKI